MEKSAAAGIFLSVIPIIDLSAFPDSPQQQTYPDTSSFTTGTVKKMLKVLQWLDANGWSSYIKNTLNLDIRYDGENLESLTKPLDDIEQIIKLPGLEDFGGNKLIDKGSPSLSLLYHILASPRVHSDLFLAYPDLSVMDDLEDFIYAYADPTENSRDLFLAVLAYEYRPAFKAPPFDDWKRDGKEFAQMVYSRCGIARTGALGVHYNPKERSFTNLPKEEGQESNIAVMPARYGLFLVELVKSNDPKIRLMNQQKRIESTNMGPRHFINPIKKIAADDDLSIQYGEYHLNDKLKRLASYTYAGKELKLNDDYDHNLAPFTRISTRNDQGQKIGNRHNTDQEMVQLERVGSSVLLSSAPGPLIRPAKQKGKAIAVKVPPQFKISGHENRRYGALKMPNEHGHEITNVVIADIFGRRKRRTTVLKSPKVAPLFANIKFETDNGSMRHLDGQTLSNDFEGEIAKGGYEAQLFEDGICDGCISARVEVVNNKENYDWLPTMLLPAFSLVTAPDFFPYIDSNDIRSAYYEQTKVNTDQDFFEGGTINLSGIRQRGNPLLIDPFGNHPAFADSWCDDKSFDTLTSVVGSGNRITDTKANPDLYYPYRKDFKSTSYLPDTGTGVFFPGWDVTYSGEQTNPFLSTFGLGSPFPEDMKLCAAANGMWPVSSPDAGRTFQGSLTPILGKRPNTAIPLMDSEIGLHRRSPHVSDYHAAESYGWDGEQGPFLEVKECMTFVNYTDIERADYLQNLLDPEIGFNMALLRGLESEELIHRMDTQRICVRQIDRKKVWKTKLWMVAAQKVADWKNPTPITCLPKDDTFDSLNISTPHCSALKEEGYVYVFVLTKRNKKHAKGTIDRMDEKQKRRLLPCKSIWVCQVTRDAIATAKIKPGSKTVSWKTRILT